MITPMMIPNPTEIHIGDKTHHQDQLITPQSFNTTNATVSRPLNVKPPDFDFIYFSPPSTNI